MTTKTLIIIILILGVLGFFGYIMFFQSPEKTIEFIDTSNSEIIGGDILALIEKLKIISIDQSIFSSALLINLKDYSIPVSLEAVGKLNPFALFGDGGL